MSRELRVAHWGLIGPRVASVAGALVIIRSPGCTAVMVGVGRAIPDSSRDVLGAGFRAVCRRAPLRRLIA
eukprot:7733478-Pyramimonas_sp.AAC.1